MAEKIITVDQGEIITQGQANRAHAADYDDEIYANIRKVELAS